LLFGYSGRFTLIGRSGGCIAGHPIHPAIPDGCHDIDLAVVLTPAQTIPDVFRQCAKAGVKRVVIESGGFAELDGGGLKLQEQVKAIAAKAGIRFIGPNGIGITDNYTGLAVPFPAMPRPRKGPVSIITQSGGVGLLYASHFVEEGVGMAKFVSMGNKIDVDEVDLIPFLRKDEQTGLLLAYLESIPRGRELFEVLRASLKPVMVHKSNIGESSRTIAGSHTAALVNDDAVVDAALRQAGAVRTASLADTVAKTKAFLLPSMKGDRVVVVSRSGGHAIIAADECGKVGMTFPKLSPEFLEQVRQTTRAGVIRLGNPLDVGDLFDIDAYLTIMDGVMALPNIDAIVFLFVQLSTRDPRPLERLVDQAQEVTRKYGKPLALAIYTWPEELTRVKAYSEFPVFESAEEAVAALAANRDWARFKRKAPRRTPPPKVHAGAAPLLAKLPPGGYLTQDQAFVLLDLYGVKHPPVVLAKNSAEAVKAFAALGGSVAMKLESPDVVHKSDIGGVILNLSSEREVRVAFLELQENLAAHDPKARFAGALMMPMAKRGVELIAGVKVDSSFGPTVMLGWGGTAAEAMEKVALRLAPITRGEAEQMIGELPGQKLLAGFRGRTAVNRNAVANLLVRLSHLACTPGVGEIDLNPVAAYPDGVLALDARVRKALG
jgi:acetyltransferase